MSFTGISGGYAIVLDRVTADILTSTDQPNILVDATGHAMITDCGLAMVTQNLDSIRGVPDEHAGDVGQSGDIQQGGGCLLVRDGRD